MRSWKIYLIHHSHTDIGYTDYQEKLELYHVDFIRQVISILERIDAGELADCRGFRWQCENYWQVENFYRYAADPEKRAFEKYVREGRIGLSGNYLNMTELVDGSVLRSRLRKGQAHAAQMGVAVKSAMSADVNGYAWGMPDALADSGVEHLFCALHSHHGMFPCGKNPSFFWWEGPEHRRVLTFVGEHYHFGNELGFCPRGNTSYMLYDDVRAAMDRRAILHTDEATTEAQELELANKRIVRYLDGLEAAGYPFDFAPIMVSGVISDNAPPNERIAARVNAINEMLAGKVHVEMATLDDFFAELRRHEAEIPVLRGDFTDWWADGVGSTPAELKLYREAQRVYRTAAKLDPEGRFSDPRLVDETERNLMLYAEHTWGYSSSISEPWNTMVASVGMKKTQYAVNANVAAYRNLNNVLAGMGQISLTANRVHRCRIVNPHDFAVSDRATVILDHWEYLDGCAIDRMRPLALKNVATGEYLPSQMRPAPRGSAVETALRLDAHQSIEVEVCFAPDSTASIDHYPRIGADGVADIAGMEGMETPYEIDTKYYHVRISREKGVASVWDKVHNAELIDQNSPYGAFAGVYEVTPGGELSQMEVRRSMGRNRCSIGTCRDVAKLTNARIVESGAVYVVLKLSYRLEGTRFFDVYLKIYKTIPLIEARVCMHKIGNLDPENLYVALPFVTDGENETYIDKTGCIIRPGIDQLPGTCQQFYLLQNGIVRKGERFDVVLATKDAPLVVFGPREAAPIRLCDGKNRALNTDTPFSWVMNNFWETNFEANLAGVYEFFYALTTVPVGGTEAEFALCAAMNEGLQVLEI